MRHRVHIVLSASVAVLVLAAAEPIGKQSLAAQANWREVRVLKMGRFQARIDVSSQHTVRLYAQLDTSMLMGEQLSPDTVKAWQENLFNELDKPSRMNYALGNAILVQPFAADSATVGYLLTVADTNGASRQVVTDKPGMEEFLDLLSKGVVAAKTLTDDELKRPGPIAHKPIALAKSASYVYPRNAKLAGLNGSALVQFVVDTSGKAKPESIVCLEATYKDFADAAVSAVQLMEFSPATLEGHKIEQLVQYPIDFKLHAMMPIKPFEVPTRRGRR